MVHLNNWEGCIKGYHLGFRSSPYIGEEILHVFISNFNSPQCIKYPLFLEGPEKTHL